MAHFKNALLGEVNGRIGNFVIRKMNGKDFISVRPRHYKKSLSQSAQMIRSNFAQISKLASFINSEPVLYQTWRQSTGNSKSVYHAILKTNLQIAGKRMFNTEYAIVPLCDLELISSHQLVEGVLEITFKNLSELPDESNSVKCTPHIIILLNPVLGNQSPPSRLYHFTIPISKKKIVFENRISLNLFGRINNPILQNNMSVLNSVVVWDTINASRQKWCATYSHQLLKKI